MEKPLNKDWKTFSDWERAYKKRVLKALTVESAFKIFSDLWNAQSEFSSKRNRVIQKKETGGTVKT